MVARYYFYNIPLLLFVLSSFIGGLSSPLYALEAPAYLEPLKLNARYQFDYLGIPFGEMGVSIDQNAQNYAITIDVRSAGVARVFVKHDSHSTATGEGAQFRYDARSYVSDYQTREKRKHVFMRYENDKPVDIKREPPADTDIKKTMANPLVKVSFDPLYGVMMLRQKLFEALQADKNQFEMLIFDSHRLTRGTFFIGEIETLTFQGQELSVYHVRASRELLLGYSEKDIARAKKEDPELHLYFTRDTKLLPVLLDTPITLGTVKARLVYECAKASDCLLGDTLPE